MFGTSVNRDSLIYFALSVCFPDNFYTSSDHNLSGHSLKDFQ